MPDLIHLAIPGFLALLIIEAVLDWHMRSGAYEQRDTFASLSMGIGNVVVSLATKAIVFSIFAFIHRFAIFRIGHQWWAWVLLFFGDEISYYAFHRASHECRFFWVSHVVHHSSQHYNLSTALRQTWTGGFFSFVFWMWLPLLGFSAVMVLTMQAVSLIYQFWIHTEMVRSLGPLEYVLNTPAHHRVHHASNPRYIDRNHGGTLIIWDRLFGTFEAEDISDKPVYGLTRNIATFNPLRIAFHEWSDMWGDIRSACTWKEKALCAFGRPGRHNRPTLDFPVAIESGKI